MNRNTPQEIIKIIQAFIHGKQIQYYNIHAEMWINTDKPAWDFCDIIYRVKPEPRIIHINEYPSGLSTQSYPTIERANANAVLGRIRCVKFVEQIE